MIIENSKIVGLQAELADLDEASAKLGFIRWQWEYYRATYDCKLVHKESGSDYYLRFNVRALEGKLEQKDALLNIEAVYLGKATFPHGLDYSAPVPESILKVANQKLEELKKLLA